MTKDQYARLNLDDTVIGRNPRVTYKVNKIGPHYKTAVREIQIYADMPEEWDVIDTPRKRPATP